MAMVAFLSKRNQPRTISGLCGSNELQGPKIESRDARRREERALTPPGVSLQRPHAE